MKKRVLILLFLLTIVSIQMVSSTDGVYIEDTKTNTFSKLNFGSSGAEIGSLYKTVSLSNNYNNVIGTLKNVIIRADGAGVVVEMKNDGSILSTSSKDDWNYNVGVTPGGKFYFDSSGKLAKVNFRASEDWAFSLNGNKYAVKEGTDLKLENGEVAIESKGDSFSYYPENNPTKKQTFSNIKEGAKFKVDKEGKMIEASFELTKATSVVLNGVEYNLPEKAKVLLKDGKVIISLPDGATLEDPKVVDKELAKDATFEIKAESGKLKLGKDSLEGTVSFEGDKDGNLHKYIKDEKYNLGGLSVTQKSGEKTEIFSDGELHPDAKGAYLSVGDKTLAIGKNTEGKGPEVKFEPGNRFLD
ncbi:MAG: hypothetical protein WC979_04335, partial [Candidatus Pacearchaeota archaeon]